MQLGRCPTCHSRLHLEAIVQDEAGRELLALLAGLDKHTATALVTYLGLFRPANRDLANDRALRLTKEALELVQKEAQTNVLAPALAHTVEQMRVKQQAGQFKPLANHNYLKRVLESTGGQPIEYLPAGTAPATRQQQRAAVSASIMDIYNTDWAT